jgi:hypothetical protein
MTQPGVVRIEVGARPQRSPEFPDLDGPVFLIGMCALGDATLVVVGEDPLSKVLAMLSPAVDGRRSGLEGRVVADALFGIRAARYRREPPGDVAKRTAHAFADSGLADWRWWLWLSTQFS